jgi:hypothetical protein
VIKLLVTKLTDDYVRQLLIDSESSTGTEEALEGEVVTEEAKVIYDKTHVSGIEAERELRARIDAGEWDNLDQLQAFQERSDEGKLMARMEAIDLRIEQLKSRLPMLLNQYLHDAYIQVLRKINALRKTKTAIFYFFYKDSGQRDLK